MAALGAMYNGLERLHQLQNILIEHPNFRPYFYSNKVPPDSSSEEGVRLLLLAEIFGDVLDYGLMVVDLIPPVKEYEGWHDFATFLHEHSPVLRQVAYEHPEWWVRLIRHWHEAGLTVPAEEAKQSDPAEQA
ncbi:hypothetical protein AB0F59_32615 [Micromonospora lupini]|uniref:hypothetical protein n=1 Tax=Micromonospora lupini TaxID=285679 RepID=UPI0033E0D059